MQLKVKIFLLLFIVNYTLASNCSPYFNPNKFFDAPEYLIELLENKKTDNNIKEFDIIKNELYKYKDESIASEINDNFGYWWNDWNEDGYEMQLTPEQTLVKYENYYFSLSVFIYGVLGDATKLKTTQVKYSFYNYTNQVNQYIKCKKSTL